MLTNLDVSSVRRFNLSEQGHPCDERQLTRLRLDMEEPSYHILITEDEPVTRMSYTDYFETAGFKVTGAANGDEMYEALAANDVDVILLDINLPGKDGLTLAKELRKTSDEIGIILVTGRIDDVDRIVGLEIGADDYVSKPVNIRELLARVKNLLRRTNTRENISEPDHQVQRFYCWVIDLENRQLLNEEGQPQMLTPAEFELLALFIRNPGRILTRKQLMDRVPRRTKNLSGRTVDVLVGRLRNKLEIDPLQPSLIETVRGEGYRFTATMQKVKH